MLGKKHLVFLAGATAPFAPPLCTALSNRIHLEGKIMEWQSYAEYKKEMLVATMQEREEFKKLYEKTKAENNILEFHLERLQRHYLWLEKGFTSWFRVGQQMYDEYLLYKEAYFGLLERYTWETASETVDNDNIPSTLLSLFRLCSLKLLSTVYKTVI